MKQYHFLNHHWQKNWAGGWSLLSCCYLGRDYLWHLEKVLGKGFDEALFISHKGNTSCYFIDQKKSDFGNFFAEQAKKDPSVISTWAKGLKAETDKILPLINKLKLSELSESNFEAFIAAMYDYGVYHRIVKIVVDYLPEELLADNLSILTEARVYAEPVYEATEDYMRFMAQKIGEEKKVAPELVLATSSDQFTDFLRTGRLPDKAILEKQFENFVMYMSKADSKLFFDKGEVKEIERLLHKKSHEIDQIVGQSAFPGVVRGKVRIILEPLPEKKFEPGEILVTCMTRPDYLSYVKKSAGFVTDAGGILSRAAITARELRKPCVIGTNSATKIFKDGDLVELDADRGIIKKI